MTFLISLHLCHGCGVDPMIEISLTHFPASKSCFFKCCSRLVRAFGDLRRCVVTNIGGERRDEHKGPLHQVRYSLPVRLQPDHAIAIKRSHGIGEELNRLQNIEDDHWFEHVEFEISLAGVKSRNCWEFCLGFWWMDLSFRGRFRCGIVLPAALRGLRSGGLRSL